MTLHKYIGSLLLFLFYLMCTQDIWMMFSELRNYIFFLIGKGSKIFIDSHECDALNLKQIDLSAPAWL